MTTLTIIGAGNMGSALARGLQSSGMQIAIADKHEEHLKPFANLRTSTRASEIIADAGCVLIAVKPQSFHQLCEELSNSLKDTLVISIMTGKTLKTLSEKTRSTRVVRAMPNLGVGVKRGMTAWIASPETSTNDLETVRKIFQSVGKEIQVSDEKLLDSFTAIAGCGPAYFFRLCDALRERAEVWGFSPDDARVMVEETFLASAKLLETGEKRADEWADAVASKGGATEAALKHLNDSGVLPEAFERARKRAGELNS